MDFKKVKLVLENRGFIVTVFQTAEEAANYLDMKIDNKTVASGGSITLEQLNMFERLSAHNEVISHWHLPAGVDKMERMKEAGRAQIFLTSANALAKTGEIVNIDGVGNRVSSTLFGHEKVYFVIGKNKLVPTYDDAIWRARNIAAPKNAQHRNRKTPCAVNADRCYDCNSPERVCRALVVLWGAVTGCQTEIVLVNEDLGM